MRGLFSILLLLTALVQGVAQPLRDSVALEAFVDGVIQMQLNDKHIVGATITIVKDGKVILSKGYGFSDQSKQTPVRPESTLFRIGSVSKLFTWISVMQLVSQGKLKLDEDINTYLKDFKIPPTYPEPITLNHLLTHTPGFEDLVIGLFARDSSRLKPLGTILSKEIPARVRPPGTLASYSNHGTAMAAYIVEQISGMPLYEYVEKNITIPLGMTQTTFRQPLPASLAPQFSKGYRYSGGEFVEKSFEFVPLYPAGSVTTSATDMVPFMRALLENGKLNGVVILDSATLALMKSPAHQHDPAVNPMRHGFMDVSRNGVTIIGHGGATFWFHSFLALFPDSNMGVFMSFNTDTGSRSWQDVLDALVDRYFPKPSLAPAISLNKKYLEKFTGSYRANRHAYQDMTSVVSMFSDAAITVRDSSGLRLQAGEVVRNLVPIDSLIFRIENKSGVYAFRKNAKGEITHMFQGDMPIMAFDKVKGLQRTDLHIFIFSLAIITGLVVLVFWPFVAWSRIGYLSHRMTKPMPFACRFVAWLNFLVLLIFYVGVATNANEDAIVFGLPMSLKVLLFVPFLNALLTLLMVIWMFRVMGVKYHRVISRLYYTFITVVAVAAFWQLYYWNLIGPSY